MTPHFTITYLAQVQVYHLNFFTGHQTKGGLKLALSQGISQMTITYVLLANKLLRTNSTQLVVVWMQRSQKQNWPLGLLDDKTIGDK